MEGIFKLGVRFVKNSAPSISPQAGGLPQRAVPAPGLWRRRAGLEIIIIGVEKKLRLLRTHFLVMRHASEVVPHPRLFVYNHTLLETFLSTQSESALQEWAFGRRLRGDAWGTDTWATAAILVYKLHQHPEWITRDPALADLFVIPLVPRRPTYNAVVAFEGDFKGEVREN